MKILVTGGAGFIGSAVIRYIVKETVDSVVNLDKLTYAGNLFSLVDIDQSDRYSFHRVDVCDRSGLKKVFDAENPDAVMHLAAESHVDRSIDSPNDFIQTNVVGTYTLLDVSLAYWQSLRENKKKNFRFHHISTDEVYGDLDKSNCAFTETARYLPSSPYSASKASADHLVRAWHRTYDFPVLISCCSNNYGPYQYPEKLIPLVIRNALSGKALTIYGDGKQTRDWIYVDDHARALYKIITEGCIGETYNVGAQNQKKNIEVVKTLCNILDELVPGKIPSSTTEIQQGFSSLIKHVDDRPGHDRRYAIDSRKMQSELGWMPNETFDSGLRKTVQWYLANQEWRKELTKNIDHWQYLGVTKP